MRYQVWLYAVYSTLFESDDLDEAYEYILSIIKNNPDKISFAEIKIFDTKTGLSIYVYAPTQSIIKVDMN